MRVLSKLFLLKERRERIISHLLNIRFVHNAAGVFIERALLPLLIAAMVAVVELVSCVPVFFFFLKTKMFDVAVRCLCRGANSGRVYFIIIIFPPFF